MRYFLVLLFLSLSLDNCITTLAPGVIFNDTSEHVNGNAQFSHLGPGRLIEKVESCRYSSIFIQPFYYGKSSNLEVVLKESKIKRIGVIDFSSYSILGPVFYRSCIIIRGDNK